MSGGVSRLSFPVPGTVREDRKQRIVSQCPSLSVSLSLFLSPLISTSIYVYLSLINILHQGGVQIELANVPHSLIFPHHLLKLQQYSADRYICLLKQR